MQKSGEKGSITLFVLTTCLFILIMMVSIFINSQNKKQEQERRVKQITEKYTVTDQELEQIYSEKQQKN